MEFLAILKKSPYSNFNRVTYLLVPAVYLVGTFSKGTHNTDNFVYWISEFIDGNFFELYHVIPFQGVLASESLMVPYPPFSLYMLGIFGGLLTYFFGATPTVLLVASNLVSVFFTFLTAVLLGYWGKTAHGLRPMLYLLTPAVFLMTPVLGYQDSIMSFFILAALVAAEKKRFFVVGLLASFAVFSKQLAVMPMFGLGLLILFSLNWKAVYKAALGFLLGFFVILSPFILTGTLPAYFRAQGLASVHTMMSAQNPNIPWVVSLISRIREFGISDLRSYSALPLRIADDNLRQFLYLSFGAITVVAILTWLLFWAQRIGAGSISPIYIGAIAVSSYNLLSFGVHENHFFMAIPILFALAVTEQGRKVYVLSSGALALNLLATCGFGRSFDSIQPLTQSNEVLYTLTSLISLTLYLMAMRELVRIIPVAPTKM